MLAAVKYSRHGLSLSYPDHLRKEGDFPRLILENPAAKGSRLKIELLGSETTMEFLGLILYNPDLYGGGGFEDVRGGEFSKFPGSREIFYRETGLDGDNWFAAVPAGERIVEITVSDGGNPGDIDDLWRPIVDSLELDPEKINRISDENEEIKIVKLDWSRESKKSRSLRHETFKTEVGVKAIYDSERELLGDSFGLSDELLKSLEHKNHSKLDHTLALSDITDPVDYDVYFHLDARPPSEDGWLYVIAGRMEFAPGRLYFGEYIDDRPELEIKIRPGVYDFRIYFGENGANPDNELRECWHVYLRSGTERADNSVEIVKPRQN